MKTAQNRAAINADFSQFVVVHTARVDWQASPSPSVWRKRLDLAGDPEQSRVTSVVRYDPDSEFPSHPHPDGEEILVLEGIFSDEHGHYPAGSYLLNPEGFSHAPFSREGCILFVKLRQYPGPSRCQIKLDSGAGEWLPTPEAGVRVMTLYQEAGYPEVVRLLHLDPGSAVPVRDYPNGAEFFLVEGSCHQDRLRLEPGSWARLPPGARFGLGSHDGCKLYLKTGHLPG